MINNSLIHPSSIVVVGGSSNLFKPGGKILENIKNGSFSGDLLVLNPGSEMVQGIRSWPDVESLPYAELAILSIPATFCPETMEALCKKGAKAFIIISAGFGELDDTGKALEKQLVDIAEKYRVALIGPNCIGFMNANHQSVFTTPVPKLSSGGIDFISSSGSTAVFIMEAGVSLGLRFSGVYTVGNAAQIKVETVLEFLDQSYIEGKSSKVIMIYVENIDDPTRFIQLSKRLQSKGVRMVALKAGMTEAGSRAASSHTGALASPSVAVKAMFEKAGIYLCNSREELMYAGIIARYGLPEGEKIAVVTHAGGAGVLMSDALEKGGMKVPAISGPKADELLSQLAKGSSVSNPIDFLATGTKEELALILDYCEREFDQIDAMAVIFGSPGLMDVSEVYETLLEKMSTFKKPVYPVFPSPVNAAVAQEKFINSGNMFLADESVFGTTLSKMFHFPGFNDQKPPQYNMDEAAIRSIIDGAKEGYLAPEVHTQLLTAAGFPMVSEWYAHTKDQLVSLLPQIEFPVVMKTIGPVHKSDIGGVILGVDNENDMKVHFDQLMSKDQVTGVLIQKMHKGMELFAGSKREDKFGHLVLFGMGGIYLEVLKDVQAILTPLTQEEIVTGVSKLQMFPVLRGIRGKKGINLELFYEMIGRISQLMQIAPEIAEMDLNPLLADETGIYAVDARVNIGRK